ELPASLDGVLDVKLQLWAIKGTFAGSRLERQTLVAESFGENPFGAVPLLVGAGAFFGAGRQLDAYVGETEARAEDVRIVLAEASDAVEPVHDAAALEPMQPPEVGHAPRELAVAAPPRTED